MELNAEQRQAIMLSSQHVLVLAGPGTGKTATIIGRAAHLLDIGVSPERILLLTFTRRAAKEMIVRLARYTDCGAESMLAGTFHHFCLTLIRRWPRLFGADGYVVIDRDDQLELIRRVRGSLLDRPDKTLPSAHELLDCISYARNANKSIDDYVLQTADFDESCLPAIKLVQAGYEHRKASAGYLDFDDILYRFLSRLLKNRQLRSRVQEMFDHILVDELQDTNPLQMGILRAIMNPAWLFCVGDDAQSIYGFRGADFENVHSFTELVPNSAVSHLSRNYRSTQGILDLSNWLLRQSRLDYKKNLQAVRNQVSKPKLLDFESDIDEAAWITKDLLRRHAEGSDWRDHLVLLRTVYCGRHLEAALTAHRIPYVLVGGTSIWAAAHVKDLLQTVRASLNHLDELAWMRYLQLWPGVGERTASALIDDMAKADTFSNALSRLRTSARKVSRLVDCISETAEYHGDPKRCLTVAAQYIAPIMETRFGDWVSRRPDFDLLIGLAGHHASLLGFLETYTLDPLSDPKGDSGRNEDRVTLSTVHSAKGTEADCCYVVQVQPGNYPYFLSVGNEQQEEEERRVLYVAITRARDDLIMTRSLEFGIGRIPRGSRPSVNAGESGYLLSGITPEMVDHRIQDFVIDMSMFEDLAK